MSLTWALGVGLLMSGIPRPALVNFDLSFLARISSMHDSVTGHVFRRYGLAVPAVGAAALLTRWLARYGDSGVSPPFFAAVLLVSWYGGLGPGMLATALSGIATGYLILPAHRDPAARAGVVVLRLFVFMIVALLTSALHAATRRATAEAKRAQEAAESASAAKSRFLAMVSHELRTPLSPVLMAAEMLEQDMSLPERVRRDLAMIRRNVELERRLIDDLVDLTHITSGKLRLKAEPVDIHEAISAAIAVCEADAIDKKLRLYLHLDARQSRVTGDSMRLQQVFWNLLRNAIKFTPAGGAITITTFDQGEGQIGVKVSDTGMGIDCKRLESIFQAFEQAEADIQQRFGGLGLGLAICRAMVEAHGGTIVAFSNGKDRGATFEVSMPASVRHVSTEKVVEAVG